MKKVLLFLALSIIPAVTLANGGDQRVVDNKYLINLSRAPFTPRAGAQTSFLASFVDIGKDKLIDEDLILEIHISKLGDAPKGNFIFSQDNIKVQGGVSDFRYTFTDNGLHEIFFDFALASNPEKIYSAPDFLIDVQKPEEEERSNNLLIIGSILGIIVAFLAGLFIGKKIK